MDDSLLTAEAGTVRWFSPARGFGFIEPDTGGVDVFVSHDEIAGDGFRSLDAQERVRFQVATDAAGPLATGVHRA